MSRRAKYRLGSDIEKPEAAVGERREGYALASPDDGYERDGGGNRGYHRAAGGQAVSDGLR